MGLNTDGMRIAGWVLAVCLAAAPLAGCGKAKTPGEGEAPALGSGAAADSLGGSETAPAPAAESGAAPLAETGGSETAAPVPAGTPGVYKGNLNPIKAAEITNAVAKLSLAEIPTKDLPKDPKVMLEVNERIRQKSDALYARYGTTMGDVMRYISDLNAKDREVYNGKLTELFLQDSKRR